MKKIIIGAALLAVAAGVAGSVYAAWVFYRAEPAYAGHMKMSGLSAPVRIFRDGYGVPHIFAQDKDDAAFALGYVHASERLFQMEMQRRAGQGRLAELVGPSMLDVDEFTRTLGLYKLAQSSFEAMSPDAQACFKAYAAGVNAWLKTHQDRLPPQFALLHDTPAPWVPADSLVWQKLMALELSHNEHLEILRARLAQKMPRDKMAWLFPMPPAGTPVTTQPLALPAPPQAARDVQDKLAGLLGLDHAASNEWVVGGALTQTGKPMLANDPHLGLEAPILWYLARIVTPQGSVKGATVPGLPIVLLGENDHVAWGFTTTGSDVEDLFVETIDPKDPSRYMTPDGSAPFATREEIIHVKGGKDVVLHVRVTRHGPVISDVSKDAASVAKPGQVVALAFTGLGDKDRTAESLLRIDDAPDAAALIDALKLYQAPPQNIVYADDKGAFGYINPGIVPVRKSGDGLMPADGASGDDDWVGTVPFDELPQVADPAAGYVFNANNAVVGPDSNVYFGQDWEEPYRARRLQQFFDIMGATGQKFTLAKMEAMQADHLSLAARDFLPVLAALKPQDARQTRALEMLGGWDGVMDAARPEPAIFDAWLYEFHKRMFAQTGVDMSEKGPFAAMTLMSLIKNHAQDWCGDADCHGMMLQSLTDALDFLTARQGPDMAAWRWGRENVAMLTNKFYSHIPLLDDLSNLSVESSGSFYTLDRGGGFDHDAAHPLSRTHGGGFRGIYDLADPDKSLFMIATGESGHIFSPHYGDLVPMWNNVMGITLSGTAAQLKQAGDPELVLSP
ncbi:MAG: penicillin acylase family protein [Alphaproteobacteria bacterium]|nr:penicillin acylase family protein [Alphaproteobacteria bacterium]